MLRPSVVIFHLLVLVFSVAQGETTASGEQFFSEWTRVETALGSVQFDGTLRLKWTLEGPIELKTLGVAFILEHQIETDYRGQPRSTWRLSGLHSSLVPEGRDHLRWQPLTGPTRKFERAKIARGFALSSTGPWKIRAVDKNEYELRTADGRGWHYLNGRLVGGNHPALGEFRFAVEGALIHEIRRLDTNGSEVCWLRAAYDEAGRVTTLTFNLNSTYQFTWNEAGELQMWRGPNGKEVFFSYSLGLLSDVRESGKPPRHFMWVENKGYARGDSRWMAPVRLVADEREGYDYELTKKGFLLRRTLNETGRTVVTLFNPRRGMVEQQEAGEVRRVWFRKGDFGGFALERIENGAGTVLETYRYDEHGWLVSVQRQGSPEKTLGYDETGRLMTFAEKPLIP